MKMMMILMLTENKSMAIRCYTDLEATQVINGCKHKAKFVLFQSKSLECGMATGCVKILKKAYEFDHLGKFIPLHKRGKDVDLFRGCFLIAAPDICYDARDELTYCWCSSGDLCNAGHGAGHGLACLGLIGLVHLVLQY